MRSLYVKHDLDFFPLQMQRGRKVLGEETRGGVILDKKWARDGNPSLSPLSGAATSKCLER